MGTQSLGSTAFFRHGHTKSIGLHMRKVLGSTAFFRHGHTKLIGLHMRKVLGSTAFFQAWTQNVDRAAHEKANGAHRKSEKGQWFYARSCFI